MTIAVVKAENIGDVATSVSLVLVLLPLFTGQRASELRKLKRESSASEFRRSDALAEFVTLFVLLVLTLALVAATWSLLWTILGDGTLFQRHTTVHTALVVSWALLIWLLVWQGHLLCTAARVWRQSS